MPEAALALLAEFYRLDLFDLMVKEGCSVDFAGKVALGLAVRASQKRRADLHRAGGTSGWFRLEFRRRCPFGEVMPHGRDVKKSGEADVIFQLLVVAGPRPSPLGQMLRLRCMNSIDMGEVRRMIPDPFDQEIADYYIYSGLFWEVYQ